MTGQVICEATRFALWENRPGLRRLGSVALTATVTVALFESFRIVLPSAYGVADASSNAVAAVAVLAVFALPLVAPLLRRWLGPTRSIVVVAVAWAAWRVAVHVPGTIPFWMAGLGAVLAMVLFALVLAAPPCTPGDRVVGLVVGFIADVVLMGAFATWEPAWQRAVVPVVVGVAVAGAVVCWRLPPHRRFRRVGRPTSRSARGRPPAWRSGPCWPWRSCSC